MTDDARAKAVDAAARVLTRHVAHGVTKDARRKAETAIAAFETTMAEAGWVMVPREPTFEQQDRALHEIGQPNPKMSRQALRDFYRAMVSAAMLAGRAGEEG